MTETKDTAAIGSPDRATAKPIKLGLRAQALRLYERPDQTGLVRRGSAAEWVRRCAREHGEAPRCWVGKGIEPGLSPGSIGGARCERAAVMEVYGLAMCSEHGEEAASGALEELAHHVEQELMRPLTRA
jgi:hypothetical protein